MRSYPVLLQLTAFFGVVYFILAGTGYNIVNYCCDSCESVGIEYLANHSCYDVHHFEQSSPLPALEFKTADFTNSSSCCGHTSETTATTVHYSDSLSTCATGEGHCDLERMQLSFYSVTPASQLQVSVAQLIIAVAIVPVSLEVDVQSQLFLNYPPPEPLSRTGRRVLAQKSVLLI